MIRVDVVTFRSTSPASALGGLKLLNDSSRVCVTFRSTSPASALGGLKLLNDSSRDVCVTFRYVIIGRVKTPK